MMNFWTDALDTPLGTLRIVASDEAVFAVAFDDGRDRPMSFIVGRVKPDQKETVSLKERPDPLGVTSRLQAYFDGQLDALSTIPVDPGGTVFQQQVWTALRAIPAGTVLSYSTLAARLEKPGASRAVGSANARNPIAIIIPCHRIIGASGELTGYAWGTERKRWLLQHEGVAIAPADVDQLTLPM